jgi:acetyl esterase/lipase
MERFKNWLIKLFFRLVRWLAYRRTLPAYKFRKAMEFFTSFLGTPEFATYEPFGLSFMEAEWITPENWDHESYILYLHGGGYGMGSINSHRSLMARLGRAARARVLGINYRLAPEHPFPAAVEDAATAYQYLLDMGVPPGRIAVAGDSAGGGLTVALLVKLRDEGKPLPAAGVCFSPWMDLSPAWDKRRHKEESDPFIDLKSIEIWGRKYAGLHLDHPLASPIHADLHGLPPLLVQVGTCEVLHYDATALRDHCLRDGVPCVLEEYPDQIHVFQVFGGFLKTADKALISAGMFIKKQMTRVQSASKQSFTA